MTVAIQRSVARSSTVTPALTFVLGLAACATPGLIVVIRPPLQGPGERPDTGRAAGVTPGF